MKPRTDTHLYRTDYADVDIAAIKLGDEITVRLPVSTVSPGDIPLFNIGGQVGSGPLGTPPHWIAAKCIVAHHPAHPPPIEVGSDVISPDGNGHGVIRAIVDGQAWVRFAPTILETYKLSELKRITV